MILGVPVSELLLLAALIIVGGFVTGILAGLFGIGGGALIVPVLYEVFRALDVPDEVRFQLCVGTSIAIIVPTNVLSFLTHRDKGAVMMNVVGIIRARGTEYHRVTSRRSSVAVDSSSGASISESSCRPARTTAFTNVLSMRR